MPIKALYVVHDRLIFSCQRTKQGFSMLSKRRTGAGSLYCTTLCSTLWLATISRLTRCLACTSFWSGCHSACCVQQGGTDWSSCWLQRYKDVRDLRTIFEAFGGISDINIPVNQMTQHSRGFAFVEYKRSTFADA